MLILGAGCLELILGASLTQIKICQSYRLKRKALLSTVTYSNPQKARLIASLKGVLLACSLHVKLACGQLGKRICVAQQ